MPEWLLVLFARYGYAVVFGGVFLENAGLPVPGETVLLAGAALAHEGRLSLAVVVATAIAGATLGDNLGFVIGRRGGRRLLEQFGGRVGLTPPRLAGFDAFFERHGARAVFFARFITGLRVVGALTAGASGLPWRTFLVYNMAGAIVWCTIVAASGYALAHSWQALERWIGRAGLVGLLVVAAVIAVGVVRTRRRRHQ